VQTDEQSNLDHGPLSFSPFPCAPAKLKLLRSAYCRANECEPRTDSVPSKVGNDASDTARMMQSPAGAPSNSPATHASSTMQLGLTGAVTGAPPSTGRRWWQ